MIQILANLLKKNPPNSMHVKYITSRVFHELDYPMLWWFLADTYHGLEKHDLDMIVVYICSDTVYIQCGWLLVYGTSTLTLVTGYYLVNMYK